MRSLETDAQRASAIVAREPEASEPPLMDSLSFPKKQSAVLRRGQRQAQSSNQQHDGAVAPHFEGQLEQRMRARDRRVRQTNVAKLNSVDGVTIDLSVELFVNGRHKTINIKASMGMEKIVRRSSAPTTNRIVSTLARDGRSSEACTSSLYSHKDDSGGVLKAVYNAMIRYTNSINKKSESVVGNGRPFE